MQGARFHLWLGSRSHMQQLEILHVEMKIEDPVGCNEDPAQPNK